MRTLVRTIAVLVLVAAPVSMLGTAGEKDQPDTAWTNLFSKEEWYKFAAGKEQIFKGKLEAIPNAGGISTLQRTSYYKLGERTIYTGAKKVAALDKLVGKQVEILGKPVNMELEGRSLKEIWPAAIKPATLPVKKDN